MILKDYYIKGPLVKLQRKPSNKKMGKLCKGTLFIKYRIFKNFLNSNPISMHSNNNFIKSLKLSLIFFSFLRLLTHLFCFFFILK